MVIGLASVAVHGMLNVRHALRFSLTLVVRTQEPCMCICEKRKSIEYHSAQGLPLIEENPYLLRLEAFASDQRPCPRDPSPHVDLEKGCSQWRQRRGCQARPFINTPRMSLSQSTPAAANRSPWSVHITVVNGLARSTNLSSVALFEAKSFGVELPASFGAQCLDWVDRCGVPCREQRGGRRQEEHRAGSPGKHKGVERANAKDKGFEQMGGK